MHVARRRPAVSLFQKHATNQRSHEGNPDPPLNTHSLQHLPFLAPRLCVLCDTKEPSRVFTAESSELVQYWYNTETAMPTKLLWMND